MVCFIFLIGALYISSRLLGIVMVVTTIPSLNVLIVLGFYLRDGSIRRACKGYTDYEIFVHFCVVLIENRSRRMR
jgi:hypothetical protein